MTQRREASVGLETTSSVVILSSLFGSESLSKERAVEMAKQVSTNSLNGSRYQIDKKNYWLYDGFIATLKMGDIRVNVFTFDANAVSVEDGIYLRTTVGPIIDDDGKSAHSLHLFANDVSLSNDLCCAISNHFRQAGPIFSGTGETATLASSQFGPWGPAIHRFRRSYWRS
ncbi:hypothetical protein BDR07DRAFT_1460512 [Suillus spraguei]|nr:hypothetical protein BDR07DRAFT_1460512 [Suillus spraguei]